MPLPVAHGIVGASVLLAARESKDKMPLGRMLCLGAVLGILPDADLTFVWLLDWGTAAHGALTHSIFFAACVGVAVTWWQKAGRDWRLREVLTFGSAVLTHGMLDMLVRKDFGGAALYWPFSDEKLRFGLFNYFAFYPGSDSLATVLWRAVQISAYEAAIFAPCLMVAWLIYAQRRKVSVRPYQTKTWPVRVD